MASWSGWGSATSTSSSAWNRAASSSAHRSRTSSALASCRFGSSASCRPTWSALSTTEYGSATLEMHRDAISPGAKVLIVDDLLATGGTVAGTIELVKQLKGEIVALAFLIELVALKGRDKLAGYDIVTLIEA